MSTIDSRDPDPRRLFRGPCYALPHGPLQTYHLNAAERVKIVKASDDLPALRDALHLRGLQGSVSAAIQRRLRQLDGDAA